MKKKSILILVLISTISCGIKTYKLKNGYSKAAIDQKVYQNKKYFDRRILNRIDTLVVYEEYNTTYYSGDKPVNALARENYENVNSIYGVYKFYGNGNFNLFMLDRNEPLLESTMFDPEYTGWRGVLYSEHNAIKGDLITQVTGMGEIGIRKQTFEFYGDTLIVNRNGNRFGNEIYIKRRIPVELLKSNAKW